jgi:hypothetical protein
MKRTVALSPTPFAKFERGSGKGYDHAEYKDQMRKAVEAWAGYVEELVTPEGTVRLRG